MFIAAIVIALAVLIAGPAYWVGAVIKRYSAPADRYAMTGAETARYLLDTERLNTVKVEATELGDHYDPMEKVVRLGPNHYGGRSLAAVTIAAHEVGHALQDARGYGPLRWRTRLVQLAGPAQKLGAGLLMVSPVVAAFTRVPAIGLITLLGGFLTLATGAVVHMVTLPTEFDASFKRALPMLARLKVLRDGDHRHARRLLTAAALTYVSASLMSLVNIGRWWAILRR
jgi:Zn-dependent membrane protease YugP